MADNLGTVRTLLDSQGNRIRDLVFAAWGEITQDTNASVDFPFAFTGREYDRETGLYFYRARYYDPRTGRFISADPLGFAAGDTNLSRYVANSPTNFRDPTGHEGWAEWLARFLWPDLDDPVDVARALNEEREYVEQINKILGTNYQKLAEISDEHRAYIEKVLKLREDFNWDCVEQRLEVVAEREPVMDAAETALEVADKRAEAADALSGGAGSAVKGAGKKVIKEAAEQVAKNAGRKASKAAIKSGAKEAGEEAAESGAKAAGKAGSESAERGAKARKAKSATDAPVDRTGNAAQIRGGPFPDFPEWGRGAVEWGKGAEGAARRAAEITAAEAKSLDPEKVQAAKRFYECIYKVSRERIPTPLQRPERS